LDDDGVGVSKLTFVGDENWKDEIFLFTGRPMRQMAIEFFHKISSTRRKPDYLKKTCQSGWLALVF